MFSYNKEEAHKIIVKAKAYSRALVMYPKCTQLPCSIKGCINKKRNGRCNLKECYLELDQDDSLTGICLSFEPKQTA